MGRVRANRLGAGVASHCHRNPVGSKQNADREVNMRPGVERHADFIRCMSYGSRSGVLPGHTDIVTSAPGDR